MDGYTLKRRPDLFIHTRQRDPADRSDDTVEIPEATSVCVTRHANARAPARPPSRGWWKWTEVDGGRNASRDQLQSGGVTAVTIPPGNYPFEGWPAVVLAACPACVCTYTLGDQPLRIRLRSRAPPVGVLGPRPRGVRLPGRCRGGHPLDKQPARAAHATREHLCEAADVAMCSDEHLNLDNFDGPHMEPKNICGPSPSMAPLGRRCARADVRGRPRARACWIGDTNLTKRATAHRCRRAGAGLPDDYEATFRGGRVRKERGGDLARLPSERTRRDGHHAEQGGDAPRLWGNSPRLLPEAVPFPFS